MATVTASIHEHTTTLDPVNRCDRCGARASVSAYFRSSDSTLLFCRHDWRANKDALSSTDANIIVFRAEEG